MAISIFQAFRSTITPFVERYMRSTDRWLADPTTGAIIGVESPVAAGPHARFTPVDVTAAQVLNPPAAMVADLDATFRLNVPPYTRYYSDGAELVAVGGSSETIIPPGFSQLFYSPLTISPPQVLVVQGTARVITAPA